MHNKETVFYIVNQTVQFSNGIKRTFLMAIELKMVQHFTLIILIVTGFGKTDHIVTIDISRNTDLKHRSHHGSLVLDCSHARFAV